MAKKIKNRLYKVERYYVVPATVFVIAPTESKAIELADIKYGEGKHGAEAERIRLDKSRVLHY